MDGSTALEQELAAAQLHGPGAMDADRLEHLRPDVRAALTDGLARLRSLGPPPSDGSFASAAPAALVAAGLHRLVVPRSRGGLGAGLRETALVHAALATVDGSASLGLAMHNQVVGAALQSVAGSWPVPLLRELLDTCVKDDALVGSAAAEIRAGSPRRGARVETTATLENDGSYVVRGEKAWVTWLPALHWLVVSAALGEGLGLLLVDSGSAGVELDGRFEALGMRSSGSGQLRLTDVRVPPERLVSCREHGQPDPRGPAPQVWFGLAVAATYLGIGEGARTAVATLARERRPADAPRGIGTIPSVAIRLGRLDAVLRVARLVVLETARRWDATPPGDAAGRAALLDEAALAKLTATNAAVQATDEALRIAGGPGLQDGVLERAFRDARAGLVHPPLEDIAYQSLAGRLLATPES